MSEGQDILAGKTLLVVDDEPLIRRLLGQMVRNLGAEEVHEAGDGGEALDQVRRTEPDLILCDINMAPMDGFAFVEALRGLGYPALREIPVLFLTADTDLDTVAEAMQLEVSGYLVKPVKQENLVQQIQEALSGGT